MLKFNKQSIIALVGAFLLAWLGLKYLLPLAMPFLLGAGLALLAEPVVKRLARKFPRPLCSAIGVTLALILLGGVLVLLTALLLKELVVLAQALPDLGKTAQDGLSALENYLMKLAQKAPDSLQPVVSRGITGLFHSGNSLFDQLLQQLPAAAAAVLGWIPDSALTLGTGILSAFMVSTRLPKLKALLRQPGQNRFLSRVVPVFQRIRTALGGWLKAQFRLTALCFLIVAAGLLLLRVSYWPLWAFLIALVDAIPVLGTGTVLLPWALICFLQGQTVQAIGLLATYVAAMLSRSILEPRLVGKQLGLDPLVTLVALYTGYQLWGIGGMLLSPVICVAAVEANRAAK